MAKGMNIREYLEHSRILTDGAMGTYYAMHRDDEKSIPEMALFNDYHEIETIHKKYCHAGAVLLRTDTFAANCFSLGITAEKADEMLELAVRAAQEAAACVNTEIFIAGDIGGIPEIAGVSDSEVFEEYKRMCQGFLRKEISVILFETFTRLDHMESIVQWLRAEAPDCFIIAQFLLNKNGYTLDGISASRLIKAMADQGEVDAVGFNCGIGSGHMEHIVKGLDLSPLLQGGRTKYFSVVPNASYPQQGGGRMHFFGNAGYFAETMSRIAAMGVDIIGSCCGSTPEYTKYLRQNITWECSFEKRKEQKKVCGSKSLEKKQAFDRKIDRKQTIGIKEDVRQMPEIKKCSFIEKLLSGQKVIAVELDPPYDANCEKMLSCGAELKQCGADIITMADSPMGRSRADSILMSVRMAAQTGIDVMPHIACRDKNLIAMRSGLIGAYINGIRNILIVTGDPVPGTERNTVTGVFDYNSIRLMQRVKEMNLEHFEADPIIYGGALNYGRGSLDAIASRMEQKIQAGASYFLTQPVFSPEGIERIAWLKERVDTKILCGIMPLVSYKNAKFIQNEITGVDVPEEIINRYHLDMSREEGEEVAAGLAVELAGKLKKIADGYYFMLPFNRVSVFRKYCEAVK